MFKCLRIARMWRQNYEDYKSIKTPESTFTATLSMNPVSSSAQPKLYRKRNRHCKAVHETGRIPVEEGKEFVITLTL